MYLKDPNYFNNFSSDAPLGSTVISSVVKSITKSDVPERSTERFLELAKSATKINKAGTKLKKCPNHH
jgi:hypothetical protein